MRALSSFTRLDPEKRVDMTKGLIRRLLQNENCQILLRAWHIQLGTDLVSIAARQLPPEKVLITLLVIPFCS